MFLFLLAGVSVCPSDYLNVMNAFLSEVCLGPPTNPLTL